MYTILKIFMFGLIVKLMMAQNMTILEKIRDDPDLSMVYEHIERNEYVLSLLKFRSLTFFAPTNEVFERYYPELEFEILYHIINIPLSLKELENIPTVTTEYSGNPNLFITKKKNFNEKLYVNNALILNSKSNVEFISENGQKKQVLHIINKFLKPVVMTMPTFYPDAFQFISSYENFNNSGHHRIRTYRQQVLQYRKQGYFERQGYHTFLIPVDESFNNIRATNLMTGEVIDAHVIFNQVLFTESLPLGEQFSTEAFDDILKVTISFYRREKHNRVTTYAVSNTLIGNDLYRSGVVIAEIVKANIPVKNGVIHLINRPLIIMDKNLIQLLQEMVFEIDDFSVGNFIDIMMDIYENEFTEINSLSNFTVFIPQNDAWNNTYVIEMLKNKKKMKDILKFHFIPQRLTITEMRQNSYNISTQLVETLTLMPHKFLNIDTQLNEIVTVEGDGINATIIHGNIAVSNGIVHIIDRVLGLPYMSIFDKISTDPLLKKSYNLGIASNFNEQLRSNVIIFTYFVSINQGWEDAENEYTHLLMSENLNNTTYILRSHLISDGSFTIDELFRFSNNSTTFNVIKNENVYYLKFHDSSIKVIQSDIKCTNGIVHIIESPLLSTYL